MNGFYNQTRNVVMLVKRLSVCLIRDVALLALILSSFLVLGVLRE